MKQNQTKMHTTELRIFSNKGKSCKSVLFTFIDLFIWNFLKLNGIYILVFSLNNLKHYIKNEYI